MMRRLDEMRIERELIEAINATGEGAPSVEEKYRMIQEYRARSPEHARRADQLLLANTTNLCQGIRQAQQGLHGMKELMEKLTAPPWRLGVFLCGVDTPEGPRTMVLSGGGRQVIGVAEGVDAAALELGDEVFLSQDGMLVLGKSAGEVARVGETAAFDRYAPGGRLVVRWRDEELVVDAAGPLRRVELECGDLVRLDRTAWIAYEKLERVEGRRFLLEDVPATLPDRVGGQRAALDELLSVLTMQLVEPEKAARYRLDGRRAVLLEGPPGCGKTLMARVAVSEVRRLSGKSCKFAVVKPGEWEDPYVGVTQQNIRACFQSLRDAARDGYAVLFLDEIESGGRARGSVVGHHHDKFLAALLAEIDGFVGRNNVAIIAATNRKDLCDPALLSRFNRHVAVPRPDMRGARQVFDIHLPADVPYSPNGKLAGATREELIDRAVARLYAPNGDNEVCVIRFRDARTRTVAARELMSGREIEQICTQVRDAAFLRDVRTGSAGIRREDMDEAVATTIEKLSRMLTRYNATSHLSDLPQDVDVVAVEPVVRRVRRPHRYVS
jgi:ATP-dependent 26S proteasome regulatory subunit